MDVANTTTLSDISAVTFNEGIFVEASLFESDSMRTHFQRLDR